jgi:Cu/Ag efflux pump CusA
VPAIGFVVDDAIVAENIVRRMERESASMRAIHGTRQIALPVIIVTTAPLVAVRRARLHGRRDRTALPRSSASRSP